jgi:cyclic di-GMP phosphodiesterase
MNNLQTARILIVDDRRDNVALLEEILESDGYSNVLGITDSRDVMDIYQSFEPDIVLLDLNMPHLDGYQVMEQLKLVETGDYVPVLVLTASQDEQTKLKALNTGARDFLSKPFNQAEVLSRIRNLVEVRLLHRKVKSQNDLLENQNKNLEQKVKERTEELHSTRLEIIHRLGLAAEYRDNETGFHIIRMSRMSQILALAYGMSQEEADIILHASPMHDVGKIGIPDRILLKAGKLNPEEWEIMKIHTSLGFKMLDNHPSRLLMKAKEIAITHHENWDGTGYPLGLKGEQIPLSGRICSIADVFDALTSDRPYKIAWSIDDSLNRIKEEKGKKLDPDLVDVFVENPDVYISLKHKYREPE